MTSGTPPPVVWSFGHLVICQNRKRTVKIRHYNINILYLYIVINDRVPEIDFDQNDLDQMTGFVCLFPKFRSTLV